MTGPHPSSATTATATTLDVVEVCRRLIGFDTSNPGSDERLAGEYVATLLSDLGLPVSVFEPTRRRTNVVTRIPGRDPSLPALLVHGHLDTVPAEPADWSRDPFSGDVADGCVWGRGAVDMKNAVAMYLAAASHLLAAGRRPERDIVLAFLADEEAGGNHGAGFLVHEHRELFEGCAVAIGEVGGFNLPSADGVATFAISVADKGLRWYELTRRGVAGHGSMIAEDNPILGLMRTLDALVGTQPDYVVLEPMRRLAEAIACRAVDDPDDAVEVLVNGTGRFRPMIEAALQNTLNVTRIGAGYKDNVIPGSAWARLDCRYLPGWEDQLHQRVTGGLGESVATSLVRRSPPTEPEPDSTWFDHLAASLRAVLPQCRVAPYVFSGGTDNKWFAELGIPTFGFTPLLLPDTYDFPAMFHGVDERVPVAGLEFGVTVLCELFAL